MSFKGEKIIFDDVPSDEFGLLMTSMETSNESSGGTDVKISTDKAYRSAQNYIVGVDFTPLSFQMELCRESPIDKIILSKINAWLFGHTQYKKLIILQDDMLDMYYNCILTNPTVINFGNQDYGIRCTVECDAPWAWEFEKSIVKDFSASEYNNFEFYNFSDDTNDMLPIVSFTLTDWNTNFTIINHTNNKTFAWKDLAGGETITFNNKTLEVTSSKGLNRVDNFNGVRFKLKHGTNELECIGSVKNLTITYQNARKVGG